MPTCTGETGTVLSDNCHCTTLHYTAQPSDMDGDGDGTTETDQEE